MHDGSTLRLKKLAQDYDPNDRFQAMLMMDKAYQEHILVTGLIYFNREQPSLHETENMIDAPLSTLGAEVLRPSEESLHQLLKTFQ